MRVTWRPVNGFERTYEVSNDGRVRRIGPGRGVLIGRVLHAHPDLKGYMLVNLWQDGKPHTKKVHTLVMLAFVGPRPLGLETNHKDCNKRNNRLTNLEYCTPAENIAHAIRHQMRSFQKGTHRRRLTDEQIREIRHASAAGESRASIARRLRCNESNVCQIALGRRWKWVR